jgi:hypothetical protein
VGHLQTDQLIGRKAELSVTGGKSGQANAASVTRTKFPITTSKKGPITGSNRKYLSAFIE